MPILIMVKVAIPIKTKATSENRLRGNHFPLLPNHIRTGDTSEQVYESYMRSVSMMAQQLIN
jgi:hypothetical protein